MTWHNFIHEYNPCAVLMHSSAYCYGVDFYEQNLTLSLRGRQGSKPHAGGVCMFPIL